MLVNTVNEVSQTRQMINIYITKEFNCSAEHVISLLSDHAQLGRFFKAQFRCIKDDASGLSREVTLRGHCFVEKIDSCSPLSIDYHIEGQAPVQQHLARIWAIPTQLGCQLHYSITCQAKKWQPTWLVKLIIQHDIVQALNKLRRFCDGC